MWRPCDLFISSVLVFILLLSLLWETWMRIRSTVKTWRWMFGLYRNIGFQIIQDCCLLLLVTCNLIVTLSSIIQSAFCAHDEDRTLNGEISWGTTEKKMRNRQIPSERSNTLGPVEYHLVTCVQPVFNLYSLVDTFDTCCTLLRLATWGQHSADLPAIAGHAARPRPKLPWTAPPNWSAGLTVRGAMWIRCLYDVYTMSIRCAYVMHCYLHSSNFINA